MHPSPRLRRIYRRGHYYSRCGRGPRHASPSRAPQQQLARSCWDAHPATPALAAAERACYVGGRVRAARACVVRAAGRSGARRVRRVRAGADAARHELVTAAASRVAADGAARAARQLADHWHGARADSRAPVRRAAASRSPSDERMRRRWPRAGRVRGPCAFQEARSGDGGARVAAHALTRYAPPPQPARPSAESMGSHALGSSPSRRDARSGARRPAQPTCAPPASPGRRWPRLKRASPSPCCSPGGASGQRGAASARSQRPTRPRRHDRRTAKPRQLKPRRARLVEHDTHNFVRPG